MAALLLGIAASCGTVLPADDDPSADGGDADGGRPTDAPDGVDGAVDGAAIDGAAAARYRAAVLADEPVAYYRFEEEADADHAVDETGAHSAGYLPSATIVPGLAGGGRGRSLRRGGGLMIAAESAGPLAFAAKSAMTLEAWIQPSIEGARERTVIAHSTGTLRVASPRGYRLLVSDRLRFVREREDNSFSVVSPSSVTFAADVVHQVVATYDGQIATLYVDGARVASEVSDLELEPLSFTFTVGIGDDSFDGTVDEVAVYAHALTAERVRAHYDAR